MPAKGHLFWHNMSTLRFFHGAMLQVFLVWAMPLAQQPKGMVSSSPGQVQLHVEAQAEEDRQVRGTGRPCPLEHFHPQQRSQDGSPGALPAKQAGFSQEAIWSPVARADREQDAAPGRSWGRTGDLQGLGGLEWLAGRGRWAYCGQRGLVKERCFHLAESLFWHATSLDLIYVSLASVQGFQVSLPS